MSPGRRGFTLIEVVVSASVISVLMLGMASAMVIAGKAVTKTSSDVSTGASAQAVQLLSTELRNATDVSEMSATAVTFMVPDRTGDGNPEVIRYAWSGVAGGPPVLDSVQSLKLTFDKSAVVIPVDTETAERTLWSYTAALTPAAQRINSGNWIGEVFTPSGIPANATKWKVTRVQYQARAHGASNGQTDVQLRTVSGGLPTTTIVDHATFNESALTSNFLWYTSSFSSGGNLAPGSQMCIAFQWLSDADSADVQYDTLLSVVSGGTYVTSTNSGSSWTAASLKAIDLVVYGTYTAPVSTTFYYLQTVGITLKAGSSSSPMMSTCAALLNQPQVTGP